MVSAAAAGTDSMMAGTSRNKARPGRDRAETITVPARVGPAQRATKAETIRLRRRMTVGEAFSIVAESCLRHLFANEGLAAQREPEAVHQMRVAIRRLRAAAAIMKDMLRDGESKAVRRELRWLGRQLGEARDGDVRLAGALADVAAAQRDDPRLQELLAEAGAARSTAYDKLTDALASKRYRKAIRAAEIWIEAGAWQRKGGKTKKRRDRPVVPLARTRLARRRRRIVKRGRRFSELPPRDRHGLRISIKTLRYGAEFFGSLFRSKGRTERRQAMLGVLESLQDSLGELNDLSLAPSVPSVQDRRDARAADRTEAAIVQFQALESLAPFWKR
jgi:CHAD domain-containing protein